MGSAASGADVRLLCADLRPALVLLDVLMAGGGPELAHALGTSADHRPVVVAVQGYFAKGRLGTTLPDALARVVDGERVLDVPGAEEALRLVQGPLATEP